MPAPDDARVGAGRAALARGALRDGLASLAPHFARGAETPEAQRLLVAALVDLARRDGSDEVTRKIAFLLGTALLSTGDDVAAVHCARALVPSLPPDADIHALEIAESLPDYCREKGLPLVEDSTLCVQPMSAKARVTEAARASFACELPEASVLGTSFMPVSVDGRVFLERCVHRPDKVTQFEASAVIDTVLFGTGRRVLAATAGTDRHDGAHVLLGSSDNIGHWLLNWYSRLMLAARIPGFDGMKVVVGDDVREMHYECLAAAGIGRDRVVRLARGRRAQFERLWVPSVLYGCAGGPVLCWHAGILDWLRRTIGAASVRTGSRRIFLTRARTRWRRLVNEAEVLAAIADLGFELVDPGALSIAAQVELAGSAAVIAGTMGAGMNLMMFAPPGTAVVTVKGDVGGMMDIDPFLAATLGLAYIPVVGRMHDNSPDPLKRDVEADPGQVRAAMLRAIEAGSPSRP